MSGTGWLPSKFQDPVFVIEGRSYPAGIDGLDARQHVLIILGTSELVQRDVRMLAHWRES